MKTLKSFLESDSDIHHLKLKHTRTLTGTEDHPVWQMIGKLYQSTTNGRPNAYKRFIATICNACCEQSKTEFLFSRKLMAGLLKADKNTGRVAYSGDDFKAYMAKAKADGILIQKEAPNDKKGKEARAGLYEIVFEDVVTFVTSGDASKYASTHPSIDASTEFGDEFEDKDEFGGGNVKQTPPQNSFISKEPKEESTLGYDEAIIKKSLNYIIDHGKPGFERDRGRSLLNKMKYGALTLKDLRAINSLVNEIDGRQNDKASKGVTPTDDTVELDLTTIKGPIGGFEELVGVEAFLASL